MNNNRDSLKILNIKIDNFLCLKNVEIKPNSKLNMFIGKNSHGKTDILEALKFVFKGTIDDDIINVNSDKAQVLVDLGKYKIKRMLTRKSHKLTVENKEGDVKKRAQAFLDVLVGNMFGLDPFALLLFKDKELKNYLLDLFEIKVTPEILKNKVDKESMALIDFNQDGFTVLKNATAIFFTKRTSINRQAAAKKVLFENKMKQCEGFVFEDYKADDTSQAYDALNRMEQELSNAILLRDQAEKANRTAINLRKDITATENKIKGLYTSEFDQLDNIGIECADLKEKIRDLTSQLNKKIESYNTIKDAKELFNNLNKKLIEDKQTLDVLPTKNAVPDIHIIEAKIEGAKERVINAESQERLYDIYREAEDVIKPEYLGLVKEADELTSTIEYLRDTLPRQLTKDANIPIQGLSFDGDKVMIGDKALKYMSTSEKIGVVLQVVRELNKDVELPLLCLDRAESLDDDTLREFAKQVEGDAFQYFLTQVQHGNQVPDNAFLVENGEIKKGVSVK